MVRFGSYGIVDITMSHFLKANAQFIHCKVQAVAIKFQCVMTVVYGFNTEE